MGFCLVVSPAHTLTMEDIIHFHQHKEKQHKLNITLLVTQQT